ncbi:hypothetical protein GGI25_001120 [Coemansia spiralis]|uniref:Anaphase-promoting complex subunit 5 n=2 Tax=Coemansia TaxID=4863 RepID=A0A9W8GDC6_9FUNG|nr:anaphase-promoting complex subunit 5-domain-containing protein [Coemansia spiralis]KAJ1995552.1 hypothetical protein EDC05_000790 [Coemansia umbellata]KAJ2625116.1 hypothetical protein GGI26_000919 [Coemansia sp. RSA 1358]KAJ2679931.1 hypothetical protein GGI25_001120 [Coemansia spiralis]
MSLDQQTSGHYNGITYLSASKLVLLVAIDQYSRHYDWGPEAQSELSLFLVDRLCEPSWSAGWLELRNELDSVLVHSEDQTLRQLLGHRLKEIQTLDALHMFFDQLRLLISNAANPPATSQIDLEDGAILLDSESIFGLFVRRCCLAFDQLEFHQVGAFFSECTEAIRVIIADEPSTQPGAATGVVRSQLELQEHLEFQIARLEAESGAPMFSAMEDQIRHAMHALPNYSRVHYLEYLNQLRTGECQQAEASLRRFFDSNAIKDNRTIYQYALLYLAAMRAQLGMVDGARQALTEATHVARDCQDHTCLLYIMCWEARLQLSDIQERRLDASQLSRCESARQSICALIDKAAKMHNHEMWAMGTIALADFLVATTAPVRQIFETLVQALAILTEHGVQRLRKLWHLAASRAWLQYSNYAGGNLAMDGSSIGNNGGVWLALLHAQLAQPNSKNGDGPGDFLLTERERVEAACQLSRVQSAVCGSDAAAAQFSRYLESTCFANPARKDDLQDTLDWLRLQGSIKEEAHSKQPVLFSDSVLRQIAEARELIASGHICDARELLLSIVCLSEDIWDRSQQNTDTDLPGLQLAQQLLRSIE